MRRLVFKTDLPLYFPDKVLPELPKESLETLVQAHRNGGPDGQIIREKLIHSQIGVTLTVASLFISRHPTKDQDLVSDALYSMVRAIDKFPQVAKDDDISAYVHKTTWYNLKQAVLRNKLIPIPNTTLRRKLKDGTFEQQDVVSILGDEALTRTPHNQLDTDDCLEVYLHSDEDKKIVKMRVAQYTGKEISEVLNVKVHYVFYRLQKIRQTLNFLRKQ